MRLDLKFYTENTPPSLTFEKRSEVYVSNVWTVARITCLHMVKGG